MGKPMLPRAEKDLAPLFGQCADYPGDRRSTALENAKA
jgi:hypothetical protein